MKLYSRESNPIAKATISLVHDTNQTFSCEFFRAIKELEKGDEADLNYVIKQIQKAEKTIKGVVDMLYKVVSEAPEPIYPAEQPE